MIEDKFSAHVDSDRWVFCRLQLQGVLTCRVSSCTVEDKLRLISGFCVNNPSNDNDELPSFGQDAPSFKKTYFLVISYTWSGISGLAGIGMLPFSQTVREGVCTSSWASAMTPSSHLLRDDVVQCIRLGCDSRTRDARVG